MQEIMRKVKYPNKNISNENSLKHRNHYWQNHKLAIQIVFTQKQSTRWNKKIRETLNREKVQERGRKWKTKIWPNSKKIKNLPLDDYSGNSTKLQSEKRLTTKKSQTAKNLKKLQT